jgi:D-Tyr-tRNAtyr deacylase
VSFVKRYGKVFYDLLDKPHMQRDEKGNGTALSMKMIKTRVFKDEKNSISKSIKNALNSSLSKSQIFPKNKLKPNKI